MSRTSVAPKAVVKASKKKRTTVGAISSHMFLLFIAILLLIPALWMTIVPSKDRAELVSMSPMSFGSFGSYITRWQNLLLYDEGAMLRWIENSIWYTSVTVILSTTMALLGGFALAAINIKFKRQILILIMIAMIIPQVALVMPMFVWINTLGLTDTELGLILASSLYPFGVYLSYIHFSTVIPRELYEAAKIDGCGYFKIFRKIAIPISKSLVGILAFFSFVGSWNNFFLPQVLILSGEKHPLSSGLTLLFTNTPAFSGNSSAILPIERSEIALSAIIMVIPIAVLFIVSQKFLSRGMLAGSVKS
jgi:multiple sugar transport system permease protein